MAAQFLGQSLHHKPSEDVSDHDSSHASCGLLERSHLPQPHGLCNWPWDFSLHDIDCRLMMKIAIVLVVKEKPGGARPSFRMGLLLLLSGPCEVSSRKNHGPNWAPPLAGNSQHPPATVFELLVVGASHLAMLSE